MGNIENEIAFSEKTIDAGLRRSKTFFLDEHSLSLAFISAENPTALRIEEYSLDGQSKKSIKIPFQEDYQSAYPCKELAKDPTETSNLQ